ncbi:hypothetical protein GCK32_003859 [Trichostrongylus colubriformis]|uniref:SURF1-like protein n=1 Tax=Trichostrongylus colubriformis TaxID=6319 RepID=A0AAN8IAL7_TRICO
MIPITFSHRVCWLSVRTSAFAAALPKENRKEIISLDRQQGKDRRTDKKGSSRGNGRNGKYKRPLGSFSMLIIPAVTFGLGCWQTYRLKWKLNLIEKLKERLNEPAVDFPLDDVSQLQYMEYRRVRVTGEFLHDREFSIAPRGRFDSAHVEKGGGSLLSSNDLSSHGAHIITPFRLSNSDLVILVNRGWVPVSRISPSSRQSSQISGTVTFDAIVRKSEKRPQFVGANVPEKGTWFYKDFDQMARQYGTAPIYLEAVYESTIPDGPIGGQSNVNVRNEHLSYLITWFSLSAATLAMWFRNRFCEGLLRSAAIVVTESGRVSMATFRMWNFLILLVEVFYRADCNSDEAAIPSDWTDPNDPTFSQRNQFQTGQLTDASKDAKVYVAYDPTLRLILRQMFKELGVDPLEKTFFSRNAKVSLSSLNMKVIGSYLEMDTLENELSIKEQVRSALHNMFEVASYDEDKSIPIWQELLTLAQPCSRSFWTCIITVFFVVSMVTTYNRIYQEKLALRMAEAMNRKDDACAPNSILEQSLEYLSSFIFFRKKSPCLKFIEVSRKRV